MSQDHRSADPAAQEMLEHARELGAQTVWDRHDALQPLCGFGELGLCCDICYMGPCRIDPFGERAQVGACGADAHLIVARNLARAVAAGAAAHSDHGREVAAVLRDVGKDGASSGYGVANPGRLAALAEEWGVAASSRPSEQVAADLGAKMGAQFGLQEGPLIPALRAPEEQRRRWDKIGITPRGIDREIVELLHRTHHGVESDPVALLRAAMRAALADGWGGSMIATDVQDVLFGGPQAIRSQANLGVLEEKQVNILVHGHEPTLSEMIVAASRDEDLLARARQAGAEGINIAGICCTANEILMRQGMPVAGNYLHQELALLTGAVDLMVVDVQCVMPSLPQVAACHHTKVVTTSHKAHVPGAERIEFDPSNAKQAAREIVTRAVEAFTRRDPARVRIPRQKMDLVAGFTNENLPYYLGGRFRSGYRPLIDAMAAGRIRGVVGVVGCNTPKIAQDSLHLALVRRLLGAGRAGGADRVQRHRLRQGRACCGPRPRWSTPGRACRKSARRWAFRRFCTWAVAWITRASFPCASALVAEGGIGEGSLGAAHRRRGPRSHEREGHHHRAVRGGVGNLHRVPARRRAWPEAAWCASTWRKTSSGKPADGSSSPTTSRRPRAELWRTWTPSAKR